MKPPRWRLDQLFVSLDDRNFINEAEYVVAETARISAWFDNNDIGSGAPVESSKRLAALVADAYERLDALLSRQRFVRAFVHARASTDAFDPAVGKANVASQTASGRINGLSGRLDAFLGRCDVVALTELDDRLAADRYTLDRSIHASSHLMSDAEERLAQELGINGEAAWRRLRDDITGQAMVDVPAPVGATVSMAECRGLATSPDAKVRDAAYRAEIDAWTKLAPALASTMNAWFGWQQTLLTSRGWTSALEAALFENGIEQPVLDAMNRAVVCHLGDWHRFCLLKAGGLGRGPKLRWSDLVAPLGAATEIDWDAASATVIDTFASFSPQLAGLARRAMSEGWIDAEPRVGKRGGAFCMPVRDDISRILMNFDRSADSVQTLAHELGHAFHNTRLAGRTEFQRRTPRALAETASILCELLVANALQVNATGKSELALLNTELSGVNQVVVDIHSRFLFEERLYEARAVSTQSVGELNALMRTAQLDAYGDSIDPTTLHQFMWAVKPHYFTPFYNFAYTFGLLFGAGLLDRWHTDGDEFLMRYDDLLSRTGMVKPLQLAAEFGIDLADEAFWNRGLGTFTRKIERFEELIRAETSESQLTVPASVLKPQGLAPQDDHDR